MLVALTSSGIRELAWDAQRGAGHTCPACQDEVVLKRGKKRVAHFAHRPGSDCSNAGESPAHVAMKHAVWSAMRVAPGVTRCELEWAVGPRRADVYIEHELGWHIAVEGQISAYEDAEVEQKIADYRALDVWPLYLVHASAFPGYLARYGMGSLHEREVRVPRWVLSVALVDPSADQPLRTYDAYSDTEYQLHTIVHVFDGTDAWLVRLEPLWRDPWEGAPWYAEAYNPKQLRLLRVVGRLDLTRGASPAFHPEVPSVGEHAWVWGASELLGEPMRPGDRPPATPPGLVTATAEYRAYMRARMEARKQAEARERVAARARRWTESLRDARVIPLTGEAAVPTATPVSRAPSSPAPAATPEQFDLGFGGGAEAPTARRTRIED